MSRAWFAVLLSFLFAAAAAAKPVVLDANVPDVAACHNILTQAILDRVRAAKTDPGADFEQWRRKHRTMFEASPVVDCQSKLWQALQHATGLYNIASVPPGTEALSLTPPDREMQRLLRAYAASAGANSAVAGGEPDYQGEVQIAADPHNPQQFVAAANTFYRDMAAGCYNPEASAGASYGTQALFGSSDGGSTWTYQCGPWPSNLVSGFGNSAYYYGSDPAVAWDAQGNAYAVYMLLAETPYGYGSAIVCARSTDAGKTWSYLGTIVNSISNVSLLEDKELLAIDSVPGRAGRMYVIWDENNVERVAYSDNGADWQTTVLPTPAFGQYDIGGDIKVGPDGTAYAIWNRLSWGSGQTGEATVFSKTTDGGRTWSTPVTVATEHLFSFGDSAYQPAQNDRGINAFASLGVDGNPSSRYYNRLYVAYSDYPPGVTSGTDVNVYVATSADGGATWQTPVKVNDDSGTATQFFPWLSVDPTDGSVNVSWYDTRADSANRKTQHYYARSSNGGASFEPNILITDGGSGFVNKVAYSDENSSDNRSYNLNQYGDYSGIAAINRQVHPFWTDSRQFYPLAGDSRLEDCATATIVNCSAPAAIAAPATSGNACTAKVTLNWSAPAAWGTNATGGTYSVYRSTSSTLPGYASPLVSNLTATTYDDTSGTTGTSYYYFVAAKNNCPGTALTPMTALSPASTAVVYGGVSATVSGSATICAGAPATISVTLTGAGPWDLTWSDGVTQSGVTLSSATRVVTPSATTTYTLTSVNVATCSGAVSGSAVITVNTPPATPSITAGSATTFCDGGKVTLTSSSATGNQWLKDGVAIPGATAATYDAKASGSYTVQVSVVACGSATSAPVPVTVLAVPVTPTVSAGGPTAFCEGGSVTLTSSATTNIQWMKDGVAIAGATAATYTAALSGSYTVQATNASNCTATSDPVVVFASAVPDVPTVTATGATEVCDGNSVTLTASSSPAYQWFRDGTAIAGATQQTYAATTSGSYTVEAVPPGCPSAMSTPVAITVDALPPTPAISAGGPTTFCIGTTVTLTSSSATGNQWLLDGVAISGATQQTYAAGSSGSYSVQVTNAKGCVSAAAAPAVVTVNAIPATPWIAAGGGTSACAGSSIVLVSSASSGNQWYRDGVAIPGATSFSYGATVSGAYTVVTTVAGCSSAPAAAINLTFNPRPPVPTATAGGPTTFCSGGGVTLTSNSATGNQWYRYGTLITGATSQTYVAQTTGDFTVVVTGANGCSSSSSNAVTVQVTPLPTAPVITATGSPTLCNGGSVTLQSNLAGAQWYRDGVAIAGAIGSTYAAATPGAYTATVTTNGCNSTASNTIGVTSVTPPAKPTVTPLNGMTNLCPGESTMLQSSAASSYQWLKDGVVIPAATGQSILVSTTGSYAVRIGSGGCVVQSDPLQITAWPNPDKPVITASGPTAICAGTSVTLTAPSGAHWSWLRNGAFIGTSDGYGFQQSLVVTDPGSYQVYVFNEASCQSVISDPVAVSVIPAPTITAQGLPASCGANATGVWLSSGSISNQWYRNGVAIPGANATMYFATTSGSYTTRSDNGCPSNAIAVYINETLPPPTVTASGPTTFCNGGAVNLSAPAASSYQWYRDGVALTNTSQSVTVGLAGSYTVRVTTNGCTSAISTPLTVTVLPKALNPVITGFATGCDKSTLTSSYDHGNQWFLNGTAIAGATGTTYDATVTGDYTLQVTLDPACGPGPLSKPFHVLITPNPPKPTLTASGPTTICGSGSVTLTSSPARSYSWWRNGSSIGYYEQQSYVATQPGAYQVAIGIDSSGCYSVSDPINVAFPAVPNATITAPSVFLAGTPVTASVATLAGATYDWKVTGATVSGSAAGNTISFTAAAAGTVTLQATVNNGGCIDAKSVTVKALPNSPGMTFTAISPTAGAAAGGTPFKITGSGFHAGLTVTFGGAAATNIVVVDGGTITGAAPQHDPGTADVVVLNTDSSGTSLLGGFTFHGSRFDPNADDSVDAADIFYLVNYLFTGGPAPRGWAGKVSSGDANNDGVVDAADIFYTVNYLFSSGPKPLSTASFGAPALRGSITLGTPAVRGGKTFVPIIVTTTPGSAAPQAIAVNLRGRLLAIHRAGVTNDREPLFETTAGTAWLASFDAATAPIPSGTSVVVAEAEVEGTVEVETDGTMLCNQGGTVKATAANGLLSSAVRKEAP